MNTEITNQPDRHRVDLLVAKLRNKQLNLALQGRIQESAIYADRASRIRQICWRLPWSTSA